MPPTDRRTSVEFRVRYAETDQMGVVYHANYLIWCEVGRTQLIRERGTTYARLEEEGVILAVAEAQLRFHAPARYDDLVRVEAWIQDLRSRMITFGYRISRVGPDGAAERLVSASTVLVALDRESRPRKLPAELLLALAPQQS